ncbi:MAG: DUF4980 domain-containing protein, partial [Prevotella sp.]|nr:DUF4980 domain-containing protein [Prevotella sp.]
MIMTAMNASGQSDGVSFLSKSHAMIRVHQGEKYILLPVEEKADMSNIRVLANDELIQNIHVRLAVDNIDYYVPFDLSCYQGKNV